MKSEFRKKMDEANEMKWVSQKIMHTAIKNEIIDIAIKIKSAYSD
jgi:hypothetical protein